MCNFIFSSLIRTVNCPYCSISANMFKINFINQTVFTQLGEYYCMGRKKYEAFFWLQRKLHFTRLIVSSNVTHWLTCIVGNVGTRSRKRSAVRKAISVKWFCNARLLFKTQRPQSQNLLPSNRKGKVHFTLPTVQQACSSFNGDIH